MSDRGDPEGADDLHDSDADRDPDIVHRLGTEDEENKRFQQNFKPKQYPPGHKRGNTTEHYVEILEQPPVSIKTGFQSVASSGRILFAGNGPDIHSFDIVEKSHLSAWMYPKEKNFPKIPETLKEVFNPNRPTWELRDEEKEAMAKKAEAKKEGPAVKRRKLNTQKNGTAPNVELDENGKFAEGVEAEPETPEVTKSSSGDEVVDKLDPFPARPTNPELWHSGLVDEEDPKPKPVLNGKDLNAIKYEESSERAPDFAPEGWTVDKKNWRRPEFRPESRLEWKAQASTATPDIPMVQCLSVTNDGKHVVAVTGSDKVIWVFDHDGNGKLTVQSQR